MHDLEIINRQNARAAEQHALKTRAAGKWGLAKYAGLNFESWADFDTEAERNQAATEWVNAVPGNRTALHDPINH